VWTDLEPLEAIEQKARSSLIDRMLLQSIITDRDYSNSNILEHIERLFCLRQSFLGQISQASQKFAYLFRRSAFLELIKEIFGFLGDCKDNLSGNDAVTDGRSVLVHLLCDGRRDITSENIGSMARREHEMLTLLESYTKAQ